MTLPLLRSAADLRALVDEIGLIPLFKSRVEGFSVEDLTPGEFWFKEGVAGPWEWREELANSGEYAYAKVFEGKAGLISLDIYPQFANFRREGYDFDARVDEGLVPDRERRLYALIESGVSMSHDLRRAYGDKGFDSAVTRLQMRAYVTVAGFDRRRDRHGVPYGWSISSYRTPEAWFGELVTRAYDEDPMDSREALIKRLSMAIPREDAERLIAP